MSNLEERIDNLEDYVNGLQLDLHAAKVAITVMSTVINTMNKEHGLLARAFQEGIDAAPPVEFENPVPEGYEKQLNEKILALLSKVTE
ncbi:hypothetical protein ACUAXF_000697 [Enterobacter hormaechei]